MWRAWNLDAKAWSRLWIAWAVAGVGTALAIIAATEVGWTPLDHVWWWWAIPGIAAGGLLEIAALRNPAPGDTLSEKVVALGEGPLSLVIAGCLWLMWWLAFGTAWPSAGIMFVGWCAWHWSTWRPEHWA